MKLFTASARIAFVHHHIKDRIRREEIKKHPKEHNIQQEKDQQNGISLSFLCFLSNP